MDDRPEGCTCPQILTHTGCDGMNHARRRLGDYAVCSSIPLGLVTSLGTIVLYGRATIAYGSSLRRHHRFASDEYSFGAL